MRVRPNSCFVLLSQLAAIGILLFSFLSTSSAKVVEYDLTVERTSVNFTGRDREALAVNRQIPGPTLHFTEGDKALIRVHNSMDEETSIHWHGILLPNQYDGVPYITTMPIPPGGDHSFSFELKHSGTYWYHSHTNLQEQQGVYGAIVIRPQKDEVQVDHDIVLMLSDWTDENPTEVLRTLKRGSEWYGIKKGSAQSWDRVIAAGAVPGRLKQSWQRMPPMDISDVAYDAFLINGRPAVELSGPQPGEKVRLRVINGGAASYFNLQFAGGPMTLISADGMDVQPLSVERIRIAVAETYDFLLTVPANGACELRATAQDGSGYASAYIGRGKKVAAPDLPSPDPFQMMTMDHSAMDMSENADPGEQSMKMVAHGGHSMHHAMGSHKTMDKAAVVMEDYSRLRAVSPTGLPESNPSREVVLELTGNMDRYVWSFNNITLSDADKILIRRGENVRFKLINKTMMHHPMHLHGHFFRVLNGQGDHAPLKHTVDVAPMQTTVLEFLANEDKDWFFHCHILYHMASGMARVVHYEGSRIDPALAAAQKSGNEMSDSKFFAWGEASALSQMNEGELMLANSHNALAVEWKNDWQENYEIEPSYQRYLSRFLSVYIGGDLDEEEELGVFGVRYILPLYLESELRVDSNGDFRLQLGSEIQLLPRLFLEWYVNTDDEWHYGLEWVISKQVSLIGVHDSEYDVGVGLQLGF
ncbi:MAG: multicopper oxidase domain-containing protein [Thermodesulfobacteriota bacterium]